MGKDKNTLKNEKKSNNDYLSIIRKFNPYHDKLGRFSTSNGSIYSSVDSCDKLTEEEKAKFKKRIDRTIKKLNLSDKRLDFNAEKECRESIDRCVKTINDGVKYRDAVSNLEEDFGVKAAKAVGRYCKEKLGCSYDDQVVLDPKLTLDFIDGACKAKRLFGYCKDLKSAGPADWRDQAEMRNYGAVAAMLIKEDGSTIIATSVDYFYPNSPHFKDYYRDDPEDTFHPKNYSPEQAGAHEYGHAVEYQMAKEASNGSQNDHKACYVGQFVSECVLERASKKIGKTMEEAVAEVSHYAQFKSSEAFAECIADYCTNGGNAAPLSQAVADVIQNEREDVTSGLLEWAMEKKV